MRKVIAAALALTMIGAGVAEARPGGGNGNGNGKNRDRFEQSGRGPGGGNVNRDRDRGPRGGAQFDRPPPREWSRGQRLPGAYQGQGVDYRAQRLRRPPAGYQWVRVGNDFVLMATSTGLIMEVIPGF